MSINQVINMIAMRNGFMSAILAMNMSIFMTRAGMAAAAVEAMLIDMIAMLMVQVSIMEIIDVIGMLHSRVST